MAGFDDNNSTERNIARGGASVNNFNARNSAREGVSGEFRGDVNGAAREAHHENCAHGNFDGGGTPENSDAEFRDDGNSGGVEEIPRDEFRGENAPGEIVENSDHGNCADGNSSADPLVGFLAASGLEKDDMPGAAVVTARQANFDLGRAGSAGRKVGGDAVKIPYHDLDGRPVLDSGLEFARFRVMNPIGDAPKYEAAAGSGNHLYVPAKFTMAWDAPRPGFERVLFITEGEKKAAAGCRHGYPTVALAGVHQWADSAERDAAKAEAEEAGGDRPRLTKDATIMPELTGLIERIKPDRVVVLFDADGAAVAKKDIRLGDEQDPRFEPAGRDGKRFVLNKNVFWAGQILGGALRRQTGLPVAADFVPHAAERRQISRAGGLVWVKRLERQGLDDWLMVADPEIVESTLSAIVARAKAPTAPLSAPVRTPVAAGAAEPSPGDALKALEGKQGYIPLGHSVSEGIRTDHFWSVQTEAVINASSNDLKSDVWIYKTMGVAYCENRWFYERNVGSKDEPRFERVFDMNAAKKDLIAEAAAAGEWKNDKVFGAGVWDDGGGNLEINSKSGRFRVAGDGEVITAERVIRGVDRTVVFPKTGYGDVINEEGTIEDVERLADTTMNGWRFKNRVDGLIVAGWVINQAFTACGPCRPNLFVTGPTSAGKTALTALIRRAVGPWSWYLNDASNASVYFIRRELGRDVVTLCLDEAEPGRVKAGSSRLVIGRDHIGEIIPALRAAFSMTITTSGGALLDDDDDAREEGRESAGGKATQGGGTREERLLASALFSAISLPETHQADRDRMIVVELDALTEEDKARGRKEGLPTVPKRLGGRIFQRMWKRRAAYLSNLNQITGLIDSPSEKVRQSLAACIAALATAYDQTADSKDIAALIAEVNAERCRADSENGLKTDHDAVLDSLMSTPVDLDAAGGRGGTMPLADVIAYAVRAGMGRIGRSGSGDKWGAALKIRGMLARRDDDAKCWGDPEGGQVWLFIARDHQEFRRWTADMSFGNVYNVLARAPGARKGARWRDADGREIDDRGKLDSRAKGWPGVWIPVDIDPDSIDADEAPDDPDETDPLA